MPIDKNCRKCIREQGLLSLCDDCRKIAIKDAVDIIRNPFNKVYPNKGGVNREFTIKGRPSDPPPMKPERQTPVIGFPYDDLGNPVEVENVVEDKDEYVDVDMIIDSPN